MIDLHILHHSAATRPDWWATCRASARAAEQCGLCTLHIMEAPGEHIGANRAEAFGLGNHPYVAYLDSDDVLIPDGIPPLLNALEQRPDLCGVYSDHQHIDEHGALLFDRKRGPWSAVQQLCQPDYPHHLAVYRRAAVWPYLDAIAAFPTYSDFVLAGLATQFGPWLQVPVLAYQRREKAYYVNHRRRIDPDTTQRARALVVPALIQHLR